MSLGQSPPDSIVPPPAAGPGAGGPEALLALHRRIEACTVCPLHATRTRAVPGDGPVTARIMAVGEAPGENEDRTGRPFVGAAGQLLTRLLQSIGLDRQDIYICNVLKCRPPGNRDPEPAEVTSCAHFLDEQVALIRPDVILLLGRHAVGRLLPGMPGISRIHGQRVRRGDRLYVPLFHPAAALYNASLLRTLEEDMQRVRGYLDEAQAERERLRRDQAEEAARAAAVRAADEQLTLF
ncbi:MAG: uracil-DNA glycosylase [Chloroflexi bacterium]|nr:uracil-DNA glycosylase [Chloroflexota bacterium]MEA2618694.1 uracil-DNA glycosylase [Chloroflexota bacterium]